MWKSQFNQRNHLRAPLPHTLPPQHPAESVAAGRQAEFSPWAPFPPCLRYRKAQGVRRGEEGPRLPHKLAGVKRGLSGADPVGWGCGHQSPGSRLALRLAAVYFCLWPRCSLLSQSTFVLSGASSRGSRSLQAFVLGLDIWPLALPPQLSQGEYLLSPVCPRRNKWANKIKD